jgi:hypothetical protein
MMNTESIGAAPVPPVFVTDAAEKGDAKESRKMQAARSKTPETINNVNAPVPMPRGKERCNKESNHGDNHDLSVSGPETVDNVNEEPVPIPLAQNTNVKAAKQSALSKFPLSKKRETAAARESAHQEMRRYSSKSSNDLRTTEAGLAVACPVQPSENEEPIYEATEYDPSSKTSFYKTKRCGVCTAIAVIITGVACALGVVFGTRNRIEENAVIETDVVTEPTIMPTTHREFSIREMIEESVLERNATFSAMEHSDPRYLALDWVVHGDKQQLTVDDENLSQRYILALLAFSFDLYSWNCGMVRGVGYCNETDVNDDYSLWLSRTDECLWFGVSCVNGAVQELDLCEFIWML